ncbi:MAG: AI-2E family transporter [Williamsia sp.]|nr:AI-2E family transporter [Williamsia sp.]
METKQYPFYIKATVILFGLILAVYAMAVMRTILLPLAFSLVIAILLNPLNNRLQKRGVPKIVAISLTMLLALILFSGVIYFLSTQLMRFGDSIPQFKQKLDQMITESKGYLQSHFGIALKKQNQLLSEGLQKGQALLAQSLGSALGTLSLAFLIPVYVFLILFYKTLIINFLYEAFSEENSRKVSDILDQMKSAIQSYMVGLLLEAVVVAIMNSAALLLLGVQYAILLGVIGAILNMLPYIGGIIAIALPILIATATKDGYGTQLGILAAYAVIQFIDNNILVPRIVSSKVQINALFSILIVLLGGTLWGVGGMFLSIPFVAILKIIFDRINDLRPWGKLLGDEIPTRHKGQIWNRRKKQPSVSEELVEKSEK